MSSGVSSVDANTTEKPMLKTKSERMFNFSNYPSRKVAMRLAYHGHIYNGLVRQLETPNTVEEHIVLALRKLHLVEPDGPSDLSRCGRTDKGVSALGNALSLTVRASSWPWDEQQKTPLDYCNMLNNVLPPTIRIVGWTYVDSSFDARFSCVGRTYRYYFCHRGLNLEAMRDAAALLKGTHNFRNFCKTDVVNVDNYERHVRRAEIVKSEMLPELVSYLEIEANSFLYNQIRCTMEILFLIGRGLEESNVVTALLTRGDKKPVYPLADATPLVLWDCHFEGINWRISSRAFTFIEKELQDIATALMIRATVADSLRAQLFSWYVEQASVDDSEAATSSERSRSGMPFPVDQWSLTGCDWTSDRTHGNLRVRKSDLYAYSKQMSSGTTAVLTARPYTKLLEREIERTFDEEVKLLSTKKRARFEANMEKKKQGRCRAGSSV